jgi:hypothetical protein
MNPSYIVLPTVPWHKTGNGHTFGVAVYPGGEAIFYTKKSPKVCNLEENITAL